MVLTGLDVIVAVNTYFFHSFAALSMSSLLALLNSGATWFMLFAPEIHFAWVCVKLVCVVLFVWVMYVLHPLVCWASVPRCE